MGDLKTKKNDGSVKDFLNSVDNDTRRRDGWTLLELFSTITGETPKMWGSSIIGFGEYHYKSERSRQEGDWPLVGFSPRKQNLSLYVIGDYELQDLLDQLGKHKVGVGCLYINKLSDIDLKVVSKIIDRAYKQSKKRLT